MSRDDGTLFPDFVEFAMVALPRPLPKRPRRAWLAPDLTNQDKADNEIGENRNE